MSNLIFPAIIGQEITAKRVPNFSTKILTSISGKEARAAFMAFPKWTLSVQYEFLRDGGLRDELLAIESFFLQVRGAWDSFLVTVPSDSVCTNAGFGVGDGATKVFQLMRARAARSSTFTEPCQNINAVTSIAANGVTVPPGNYSVGPTGLVTFTAAPASGALLTWTGTYYFRCRFVSDELEFERFLMDIWKLGKCEMIGAPGNRV